MRYDQGRVIKTEIGILLIGVSFEGSHQGKQK